MNEGKPAGQRQERVQRRPVPGRKAQFKHSRVTDTTGKGLAPVWRGGCMGRDPGPGESWRSHEKSNTGDGPGCFSTGDTHHTPPFSPRSRSGSPARPAAVQGAKRGEADPLTARTGPQQCTTSGKRGT